MNLKQVLMLLGNRLVTEKGFAPGNAFTGTRTTRPIVDFTEWLNNTPDAREILAEMGVEWPVVTIDRKETERRRGEIRELNAKLAGRSDEDSPQL